MNLALARSTEAKRIVARITGETSSGLSVEDAEQTLQEASAALRRADNLRQALDDEQRQAENSVALAERAVHTAVGDVVRSEGAAAKLLEQFDEARRLVHRLHNLLTFLSQRNCLPPSPTSWESIRDFAPSSNDADAAWHGALAKLESDPDAPLPE